VNTKAACEEKPMKKKHITAVILFAALFFAVSAFAEIRVVSVKGTASYKAGGQWVPLQAGTALAVGTKVSTGVRSNAVIKINNHTVTVQPLTIMKINESVEDGKSSTTRLGLRRGSVRTKVARDERIKTVFKVSTPVATSSVRGTEQIVVYSPTFGMRIFVIDGTVTGQGANGAEKFISGDLNFWQKLNTGNSENIMNGMDDFLTQTHSLFITVDEETAAKLFGDDFMNYEQAGRGSLNQNAMVPVKIYLIWPSAR
jgi:hypothetical protein